MKRLQPEFESTPMMGKHAKKGCDQSPLPSTNVPIEINMTVDLDSTPQPGVAETPIRVDLRRQSLQTPPPQPQQERPSASTNMSQEIPHMGQYNAYEPVMMWVMQVVQQALAPVWREMVAQHEVVLNLETEMNQVKEGLQGLQSWFVETNDVDAQENDDPENSAMSPRGGSMSQHHGPMTVMTKLSPISNRGRLQQTTWMIIMDPMYLTIMSKEHLFMVGSRFHPKMCKFHPMEGGVTWDSQAPPCQPHSSQGEWKVRSLSLKGSELKEALYISLSPAHILGHHHHIHNILA
jgi:hypothetical protein